jgi:integrase
MARPPLPVGAHGNIRTRRVTRVDGSVAQEASCRFRGADGHVRRVKRIRRTKAAAENALQAAVVELANQARGGEVTPSTKFSAVAELWFADIELQVIEGRKSPKTSAAYRSYLDMHVLPAMGELLCREVDTPICHGLITAKRRAGAKDDKLAGIRNVLNCVCSTAVRLGAMTSNPVRELARLERVERKQVRALTDVEMKDLFGRLDLDEKARELDLGDVLRGMLATGVRVSEMLGCSGDDVLLGKDGERTRVVVAHRTTRIKGQGIVRRRRSGSTKGEAQELPVPEWVVPLLRARKLASGGAGPLFPDAVGWWRSNDSVTKPLRDALDRAGYEWVTSHSMRKTVARVLKAAGLPVRDIADQLGQASTVVTERHYLEKGVRTERQVTVLDGMMQ